VALGFTDYHFFFIEMKKPPPPPPPPPSLFACGNGDEAEAEEEAFTHH
jgi:hypothetical protein